MVHTVKPCIRTQNRNFGQKRMGIDTFWELIGKDEIWPLI